MNEVSIWDKSPDLLRVACLASSGGTLDEKLCVASRTVAACREELDNCRMTLAAANDTLLATIHCPGSSSGNVDCSQAYESLYEQNGQMVNERHGLATTNFFLRQELERAYKIIEASHTQECGA